MIGSVGSFLMGPPVGLIIDKYGYAVSLLLGGVSLVLGYCGLQYQFDQSWSSVSVSCGLMFLIGTGSTFVNSSCIKKCAVNFPTIRGLATSLPISMIGLSASFYSIVGSTFYPGDTSAFLRFLWVSCLVIFVVCFPAICTEDIYNAHQFQATRTSVESQSIELEEMRAAVPVRSMTPVGSSYQKMTAARAAPAAQGHDITGAELLRNVDFWLLFVVLSIFAGMGQMFIYSVGYIVKALFGGSKFMLSFDNLEDYETLLQQNQQLQVTMISVSNSVGRIAGGVSGDFMTTTFKRSRSYLLVVSTACLATTQVVLYYNQHLNHLWFMSLVIGFFYGFNYSVYPTLVGDKFGMKSFSFNYGVVGMAPILSNYLLTKEFGFEYDSNISKVPLAEKSDLVDGSVVYVCELGNRCYNGVFLTTSLMAAVGFSFVLFLNYRQYKEERAGLRQVLPKVI